MLMQSTRSAPSEATTASSTAVSGLKATPTARPSARACSIALHGSSQTSAWNVTLSPPATAIWPKWRSGLSTMRWQSRTPPPSWTMGAIERSTIGPIVIGSTKWPSPTSKWKTRAPAFRRWRIWPPRMAEVGEVRAEVDRLGLHLPDDVLVLGPVDRADRVGDRPAGADALERGAKELELQARQRLGAPAEVGPRVEAAEPRAGGVDQRPVEARQIGRKLTRVGVDDREAGDAEPPRVLGELARSPGVLLDCDHLGARLRELGRLAPGGGAQVEDAVAWTRADGRSRQLRSAALRPRVPRLEPVRRNGVDDLRPLGSPHGGLGRLVLRTHEGERVLAAELPPPGLRDPVRVRVRERCGGGCLLVQAGEQGGGGPRGAA